VISVRYSRRDILGQIRVVYVATSSEIKAKSVYTACAHVFAECGRCPSVVPLSGIHSQVSEQPHGFDETELGCANRLRQSVDVVQQQQQHGQPPLRPCELGLVIAIENGIWQQPEAKHEWSSFANATSNYYDAAVVQLGRCLFVCFSYSLLPSLLSSLDLSLVFFLETSAFLSDLARSLLLWSILLSLS
jgi:hypothetical protein